MADFGQHNLEAGNINQPAAARAATGASGTRNLQSCFRDGANRSND